MLFTALSPVSHHGKLGGKALIPNGTKRMPNKDLGPLSDSLSGRGGWSDKLDRLTFVSIQLLVFTIPLERALVVPGRARFLASWGWWPPASPSSPSAPGRILAHWGERIAG